MDIDKATPRPWTYDAVNQEIVGANNETIGGLHSAKDDVLAVQAVNAYDPLVSAAQTLALVLRGIGTGAIKDQTIMDTSNPNVSSYPMRALSSIIAEKLAAVDLAIATSKPETKKPND